MKKAFDYVSDYQLKSIFPLENTHFPTPLFIPKFENVFLKANGWNFACPSLTLIANYSLKKFSPTPYPLTIVHLLQTDDGRTDKQTTTTTIARPLLKYGRLKTNCYVSKTNFMECLNPHSVFIRYLINDQICNPNRDYDLTY